MSLPGTHYSTSFSAFQGTWLELSWRSLKTELSPFLKLFCCVSTSQIFGALGPTFLYYLLQIKWIAFYNSSTWECVRLENTETFYYPPFIHFSIINLWCFRTVYFPLTICRLKLSWFSNSSWWECVHLEITETLHYAPLLHSIIVF